MLGVELKVLFLIDINDHSDKPGVGLTVKVTGSTSWGLEFNPLLGCLMNNREGGLSLSSFRGRQNEYERAGNRGHCISGTATPPADDAIKQPQAAYK